LELWQLGNLVQRTENGSSGKNSHKKHKPEIYKGAYLAAITLTNLPTYLRPAEFSGMN
jgi:hypothetical protein